MKDCNVYLSCSCQNKKKVRDLGPSHQSQPESPVSVIASKNSTWGCKEWKASVNLLFIVKTSSQGLIRTVPLDRRRAS